MNRKETPGMLGRALTQRENQIMKLVAMGQEDKEIAAILGVARHTITNTLSVIRAKLGVRTRTELAVKYDYQVNWSAKQKKGLRGDVKGQALSPRQMEVVEQVAMGKMDKEIAQTLNISVQVVKNHLTLIKQKLDLHTRTAVAVRFDYVLNWGAGI